jgi:hypothetical protein
VAWPLSKAALAFLGSLGYLLGTEADADDEANTVAVDADAATVSFLLRLLGSGKSLHISAQLTASTSSQRDRQVDWALAMQLVVSIKMLVINNFKGYSYPKTAAWLHCSCLLARCLTAFKSGFGVF